MNDQSVVTGSGTVWIGTITRPHGLRGHLKVRMEAGSRETLQPGSRVWLRSEGRSREAVLEEINDQGATCLVLFSEVRDRGAAEELAGWSIHRETADLPTLEDDEYYWHEVVGSKVFDEEGRSLGTLEEIFSTPAHDIWVARNGKKEYLIPAVAEFVLAVDRVKKEVRVQNLKELWEVDGR